MSSGTFGGQVGNTVGNFFERKFGKKKAKFIEATAGFIVASFLLYVYLFLYKPISMDNLIEISFQVESYEQLGNSKEKGTISLKSVQGEEIKLNSDLWENESSAFEILNELNENKQIKLIVKSSDQSQVYGLKTLKLNIKPDYQVEKHNKNRDWIFYLSIFFYVISVAELVWAITIKK